MSLQQDYSLLDRTFHRLAFANRAIQLSAADIERSLYGSRFRNIAIDKPLFITSLPRAGTTLLLEIFSRIPCFATHRYRDMPFILAPMLWQNISRHFRKQAKLKERAHGDGMQVSYDSPEAFEEVLWYTWWPEQYRPGHILPWPEHARQGEFSEFLLEHMQKIIALRAAEQAGINRYVSKNNANIARIGFLKNLLPDADILVPFRHPVDHAASMLRQHRNFLARHRDDRFSEKYMHDIGHFEFGRLHRPLLFNGDVPDGNPEEPDYWIEYWIAAFEHAASHEEHILLLSFERFCSNGAAALGMLADRLGFDTPAGDLVSILRAPPTYRKEFEVQNGELLDRACALHERLLGMSII